MSKSSCSNNASPITPSCGICEIYHSPRIMLIVNRDNNMIYINGQQHPVGIIVKGKVIFLKKYISTQ